MPSIFISYRRADTGDLCDRLATRLRWAFGEDAVFRDVNTILAGSSFPDALREGVEVCPVMLALIGPQWLAPVGAPPRRRIDDADDWVRAEIASALRMGHLVIPVFAPGAPALAGANLPPDLEPLARFTPLALRSDPIFDADVQALTRAVRPHVRQGPASWLLLLGGVFLALTYLTLTMPSLAPNGTAGLWVVASAVAQVALGGYLCWRALARRAWGWLAAGALILAIGVAQFATHPLTGMTATQVYIVLDLVTAPLAAGLCLIAGWTGPRLARAPDTLRVRRTGWHTALAVLLGLTAALLIISWVLLVTQFASASPPLWIGLLYFAAVFVAALMTAATGVVTSIWTFNYRRIWWGVSAIILTVAACLAQVVWLFTPGVVTLLASVALPIAFVVTMFIWLTSHAAGIPAAPQAPMAGVGRAS